MNNIIIIDTEIEQEDASSNQSIMTKPFDPKDIEIKTKPLTIDLFLKRLSANPIEIDLYPDFQRKSDLWNEQKQSQLIESILISFPLPAFYFDGSNDNKWLVIDGLQRLGTLKNFAIDKNLKLTGLEFLKKLEGKRFDDLERTLQRKIEESQVIAYITNPGTPPDVMYNIFKRINTGGLILEPQEIRHALNQGIPANFITQLANSEEFKNTTNNFIPTERMLDREFVTRFISFYINKPEEYIPDLNSFMNRSLSKLKEYSKVELDVIENSFKVSMNSTLQLFGEWAFRRMDNYPERRSRINKSLFEVWSVCLAKLDYTQRNSLIKNKKEVMDKFSLLCKKDSQFINSITGATGDEGRVKYRFAKIDNLIREVVNK